MLEAVRYHDISCGHRVYGHESKCKGLHGHNYRIHFHCVQDSGGLDSIGRVIDFGVIKSTLCAFLEETWDHKTLIWTKDPMWQWLSLTTLPHGVSEAFDAVIGVPFNPTAENMGQFLLQVSGPALLKGTGVRLSRVVVEETRKCSVVVT